MELSQHTQEALMQELQERKAKVEFNADDYVSLSSIEVPFKYSNDRQRLKSMNWRCAKLGINTVFYKRKNWIHKDNVSVLLQDYSVNYDNIAKTYNGETYREIEKRLGLKRGGINNRLELGWTIEEACSIGKGETRLESRRDIEKYYRKLRWQKTKQKYRVTGGMVHA